MKTLYFILISLYCIGGGLSAPAGGDEKYPDLLQAVEDRNDERVRQLLVAGENVNTQSLAGYTAAHLACSYLLSKDDKAVEIKAVEILKILGEFKADFSIQAHGSANMTPYIVHVQTVIGGLLNFYFNKKM